MRMIENWESALGKKKLSWPFVWTDQKLLTVFSMIS